MEWLREPVSFGVWLATCLVIGLLFAAGLWLYSRIQVARVDALEQICLRFNKNSQDNRDFVVIDTGHPELNRKVRARFHKTKDCHAEALRTASRPPPQPATPRK